MQGIGILSISSLVQSNHSRRKIILWLDWTQEGMDNILILNLSQTLIPRAACWNHKHFCQPMLAGCFLEYGGLTGSLKEFGTILQNRRARFTIYATLLYSVVNTYSLYQQWNNIAVHNIRSGNSVSTMTRKIIIYLIQLTHPIHILLVNLQHQSYMWISCLYIWHLMLRTIKVQYAID